MRPRGIFNRDPAGAVTGPCAHRPVAFTLIELLTVIAIVGVLAGILLPATLSVRVAARRAKTKVLFAQWGGAMESFRQEYGYYPVIDGGSGKVEPRLFAGALTGKSLQGAAVAAPDHLAGNLTQTAFYALTEDELNETRTALVDAFGNSDIAVLCDRNGDGQITGADGSVQSVCGQGRTDAYAPAVSDLDLGVGIRAGVIFYSAGPGTRASDLVFSWK